MTGKPLSAEHQKIYELLYASPDADVSDSAPHEGPSDIAYYRRLQELSWGEDPSGHLVTDYEPQQIEESKGE